MDSKNLSALYGLTPILWLVLLVTLVIVGMKYVIFLGSFQYFLTTSLGLLAFIGLFYPLVLLKDIKLKIELINKKLSDYVSGSLDKISDLKKKIEKKEKIYDDMIEITSQVGFYENLKTLIKLEAPVFLATLFYLVTIIFRIFLPGAFLPVQIMVFTAALLFTIYMVVLWFVIIRLNIND